VYEHSGGSSLKVSFRSLQELDDCLQSRFRNMLLKNESENASRKLDVMSEVHGQIMLKQNLGLRKPKKTDRGRRPTI